jgi:hypothetical protein
MSVCCFDTLRKMRMLFLAHWPCFVHACLLAGWSECVEVALTRLLQFQYRLIMLQIVKHKMDQLRLIAWLYIRPLSRFFQHHVLKVNPKSQHSSIFPKCRVLPDVVALWPSCSLPPTVLYFCCKPFIYDICCFVVS